MLELNIQWLCGWIQWYYYTIHVHNLHVILPSFSYLLLFSSPLPSSLSLFSLLFTYLLSSPPLSSHLPPSTYSTHALCHFLPHHITSTLLIPWYSHILTTSYHLIHHLIFYYAVSRIPESLVDENTQLRFQQMLIDFKEQGWVRTHSYACVPTLSLSR